MRYCAGWLTPQLNGCALNTMTVIEMPMFLRYAPRSGAMTNAPSSRISSPPSPMRATWFPVLRLCARCDGRGMAWANAAVCGDLFHVYSKSKIGELSPGKQRNEPLRLLSRNFSSSSIELRDNALASNSASGRALLPWQTPRRVGGRRRICRRRGLARRLGSTTRFAGSRY